MLAPKLSFNKFQFLRHLDSRLSYACVTLSSDLKPVNLYDSEAFRACYSSNRRIVCLLLVLMFRFFFVEFSFIFIIYYVSTICIMLLF